MPFDDALAASPALRGFFATRNDASWRNCWGPGAPTPIKQKLDGL
eukprot:gene32686-46608_t